ncbi:RNA-directed DNA polymerase, eukaryota [Tanacetum coccineum]
MTMGQFTDTLFNTTLSEYSLTPPRDESKRKSIATEDNPMKELIPFMDEGGSALTMQNLRQFSTFGIQMSVKDVKAQLEEMKRLKALKTENEKSKMKLKKVMTLTKIKAQAQRLAEYEAKRAKMLKEYNHYITYRADPPLINKMGYRISNIKTQAGKLGIPPLPELLDFGLSTAEKKQKRSSEIIKEIFVKEDIVVDEMYMNLVPPPGVEGSRGLVIREPESRIFFYNGNFDLAEEMFKKMELTIEVRNDVTEARRIVKENLDGLGQIIWVKQIPIKVNVLAWKISMDRLPTRVNLHRRGVQVSPISCPICCEALENLDHLLFCCDLAKDIARFNQVQNKCWKECFTLPGGVSGHIETISSSLIQIFEKMVFLKT